MAVESVANTAADHIEEVAEVARHINTHFVQGFAAGGAFGLVVGFIFGYRLNREKIRAEAFKAAEEDMVQVRMYYHERYEGQNAASKVVPEKPALEDVVEERKRPMPPPVPVQEPVAEKAREVQYPKTRETGKEKDLGWDYGAEMQTRSPNHPYIIHQDEFNNNQLEFGHQTWTYYAGDDILSDERDEVVVRPELVVGEENLKKFGHGSDDTEVVFIRNEKVGMEFEICRSWKSYASEVHGIDPEDRALDEDQDEARS
jgi:hypothetical protein